MTFKFPDKYRKGYLLYPGLLTLVLGLTTCQPLWVILCHLPEKGRREIEEIIIEEMKERDRGERKMNEREETEVEEMKERDRGERKMNEREETEEIITFPLYPYLLQG